MKRILSIIGCVIVLAATSCTKKYITPNPNLTVFKTIAAGDWVPTTDGKSYSAELPVDAISPDFNHYGGVIVSISYKQPDGTEVYEQLPQVYNNISYTFTYNAGSLAIYTQSSDGYASLPDGTAAKPVDPITVKIVLVASGN